MNLVQTKQVQGLEGRLTTLETGTLKKGALVGVTGDIYQIASGNFSFTGNKNFYGNVTIDSPQGLGVQGGSLYVYGYGFIASGLNVGNDIADPRINSTIPRGMLNVTGGSVYVENGGIYVEHGDLSVSGNASVTGYVSGSDDAYFQRAFVTGTNGEFFQLNKIQCSDLTKECNLVYTTGVQYIEDLNVSGSLNVSGNVSGSGDAYFQDVYAKAPNGDWIKLGTGHGSAAAFTCQDLTGCNVVYSTGTQYVQDLHVSGSLNVTGSVSGSGDAYFKDIYVTGANGDWIKLGTGHGSPAAFTCQDLGDCNLVYSTGTQYIQDLYVTGATFSGKDFYAERAYVTGSNGEWMQLGTGGAGGGGGSASSNAVLKTGSQSMEGPLYITSGDGKAPSASLIATGGPGMCDDWFGGDGYFLRLYVTGIDGTFIQVGTGGNAGGGGSAFSFSDLSDCNVVYSTGTQYIQDLYVTGATFSGKDFYAERVYVTGLDGGWIQLGTGGGGGGSAFTCSDLKDCNLLYSTGTQVFTGQVIFSGDTTFDGDTIFNGTTSGSGDAYFSRIYVTGSDGKFIQVGTGAGGGSAFSCSDLKDCNLAYTTGTQVFSGDVVFSGNTTFKGNVSASGSGFFAGDVYISGTSGASLYVGSGLNVFCVDEEGRVGIGSGACENPLGLLNVSGDAYIERLWVTGAEGDWGQVTTGGGGGSAADSTEAYVWFTR